MSYHYPGRIPSRDRCQKCGRTTDLTRHHLVPRRKRLVYDKVENIAVVCRSCHDEIESADKPTRRRARAILGTLLTPAQRRVIREHMGRDWADYHYPPHLPEWLQVEMVLLPVRERPPHLRPGLERIAGEVAVERRPS